MTVLQQALDRSATSTSIVVGIAVVGKSNEPLYLCDCEKPWLDLHSETEQSDGCLNNDQATGGDITDQDPFGFLEHNSRKLEQRNSMTLSCQQLIYAAIDNLEEKMERPSGKNGQMPVIIRSNTTSSTKDDAVHWLGLLLDSSTSDGYAVYGYITATNIKLMVITKDLKASSTNKTTLKDLQLFLQEVHQHYITYLLNPFCDTRGGSIRSKQFDIRMATSIQKVQQELNYILQN